MLYSVRKAVPPDLPAIMEIYAHARKFMAETGNPRQWGANYPPSAQLMEDMEGERLYVLTQAGHIRGVFYFALGEDLTYAEIYDGSWRSSKPYGTIHRIASDGSGGIFSAALAFCRQRCGHLRIDTHRENHVMQHVLERHGFSRRGIIYIADGSERIAYDYLSE